MDDTSNARSQYVTHSRHQLDERLLLLRGGVLDGLRCAAVTSVGQRVQCGEGEWSVDRLYLVTSQTVTVDGDVRSVAVPALTT